MRNLRQLISRRSASVERVWADVPLGAKVDGGRVLAAMTLGSVSVAAANGTTAKLGGLRFGFHIGGSSFLRGIGALCRFGAGRLSTGRCLGCDFSILTRRARRRERGRADLLHLADCGVRIS